MGWVLQFVIFEKSCKYLLIIYMKKSQDEIVIFNQKKMHVCHAIVQKLCHAGLTFDWPSETFFDH